MTTLHDRLQLEEHLSGMISRRAPTGAALQSMHALSIAIRHGDAREIEAMLALSRAQQQAIREIGGH